MAGRLRLVAIAEVRYLRADRKYVEAGYPGGELLLDESLAGLEEELGAAFIRVHRNALVAVRYVSAVVRTVRGGHVVELDGVREVLDVSRRMVSTLRTRVRE